MTSVQKIIEEKLKAAFAPAHLDVINESHKHAGHASDPGTGESHFRVEIIAEAFSGKSRVTRQREILTTLKAELDGPVHALSIKADAPPVTE